MSEIYKLSGFQQELDKAERFFSMHLTRQELKSRLDEIERLIISLQAQEELTMNEHIKVERLNKALLDIKELVVNNACLNEEDNKCVDDLIYYKCDELLDIVNTALGSDKE